MQAMKLMTLPTHPAPLTLDCPELAGCETAAALADATRTWGEATGTFNSNIRELFDGLHHFARQARSIDNFLARHLDAY